MKTCPHQKTEKGKKDAYAKIEVKFGSGNFDSSEIGVWKSLKKSGSVAISIILSVDLSQKSLYFRPINNDLCSKEAI